MTRIAVITDTHANLPALEAALAAIGELGCEAIFHTGDAVGIGPSPQEVTDRLLHTPGVRLTMGNHDELCAFENPEPRPIWLDDRLAANAAWTRAHVDPGVRRAMATWPYEIVEVCSGWRIAFLHYPRDAGGDGFAGILPYPTRTDLDRLFAGQEANLILYGHHHPAADQVGRARYINPGSLGCGPMSEARFTVVEFDQSEEPALRHHAVPYDRTPLHDALVQREVPDHEFLRRAFFP